jgi:hypothetical protein
VLITSPQDDQKRDRPHKTLALLLQLLLRLLLRWSPDRSFVLAAHQNCGSHEMALLAPRTRGRLHLVSEVHTDANLYESPLLPSGQIICNGPLADFPPTCETFTRSARDSKNLVDKTGNRRNMRILVKVKTSGASSRSWGNKSSGKTDSPGWLIEKLPFAVVLTFFGVAR